MLNTHDAAANLPVKDIPAARKFYEETLGFQPVGVFEDHVVTYRSGRTLIHVYQSAHAGTNQATAVTWDVPNADEAVRELKSRGVRFEHYDLPGTTRDGDVHVSGPMRVAWFKDPDGNILNVASVEGEGRRPK